MFRPCSHRVDYIIILRLLDLSRGERRALPGPAKNLLERRFLDFQELLSRDLFIGFSASCVSVLKTGTCLDSEPQTHKIFFSSKVLEDS